MNKSLNEKLINFINDIAENVFIVQFVISTIGLVMNVPHLLILLHNSMRTSSTNSIMIGMAICDLIVLSENVYERVQGYWFFGSQNPCINDSKFWYMYSLLIGDFLQTVFERASYWLGVSLAFTRLVIMKMSGTTLEISKPLFGYLLILALVGLSSVLSAYYYCGYSIAQWGTWEPEKKCTGYHANYSEPTYYRNFADNENVSKVGRRYQVIDGVSRILVSISYPILTILLIFEIRKSAKFASKALNSKSSEERWNL
ncbi:Protein CBG16963 [Caenorhabditis briggsae]|uniref:Protein CBG16963 n=1 Tax=Caenorhabditis briggsae TaxID=6238 RepID=E3CU58_CAEBR|nr:Protein CBG16963 [Caenorhabditis briggsae]CBX32981.1 Protein CBG16963 [Caenorhabditis briggsae]